MALVLALAFSLSACGSQPGTATPPTGSGGENDSASPTPASYDTTYWTAVRYESYNPSFGRTEVSAMPTEKWWADLYLNEDGTALFREALGFGYASYLINAEWWLGADNALRLTGEDLDGSFISMDGRKEKDGSVMLETPYGNRFYFEPTERPASGGELCMADLEGTWRMSAGEAEGDEFSPEEMHMASLLNMQVSEIMAQAISVLADEVEQTVVHATYGNHLRTVQNKNDSIHADNMERLIPWWLEQRLRDRSDIVFPESEYYEFLYFSVCGYNICAAHGDLDNVKNAGKTLHTLFAKKYSSDIDYVVLADKHHKEEFEELGIESMIAPCLCGTDDYANGKRLYSTPAQLMMVFRPGVGADACYQIKLN